jgi:hypothetical protein
MERKFKKDILEIEWIHRDEILNQCQIQERELKEEFNETTSFDQKSHLDEIKRIKATNTQEVTRLKGEQYEISTYNENIEEQLRRLQQDNDLLKKIVEENQSQTVSLDIIKGEAIKMNERIRDS